MSKYTNTKRSILTPLIAGICVISLLVSPVYADDESLKEEKTKKGFMVDLKKLLKRSKKKIEQVDERLEDQAKIRRNQKRAAKAHEYYSQGVQYFEDGNFEKAQEMWRKAIRITDHPEMKGFIRSEMKKDKKQAKMLSQQEKERLKRLEAERGFSAQEVEEVYELAVKFYKKEKWLDARTQFEKVDEMFPDHKATKSYLMLIDQRIQADQQEIIEEKLRETAHAKMTEKEKWRKEIERKEIERSQTLEQQAGELYTEALLLYKAKRFEEAKQKFKEVEWVLPDYKKTLRYLGKIDADIERYRQDPDVIVAQKIDEKIDEVQDERLKQVAADIALKKAAKEEKARRIKEEAEFLYDAALGLYNIESYDQALKKFRELDELSPDYKQTRKHIKKLAKITGERKSGPLGFFSNLVGSDSTNKKELKEAYDAAERKKKEEEAIRKEKAGFAYRAAKAYYDNDLPEEAKDRFYEVHRIYPGYKSTTKYLSKLDPDFDPDRVDYIIEPSMPLGRSFEELYDEAVGLYRAKKLHEARFKFNEIANQRPDYRAVQTYLNSINQNIAHQKGAGITNFAEMDMVARAEISRDEELFTSAEKIYDTGIKLYEEENLTEAKAKFITVEATYPNFRDTRIYLQKIDEVFNSGGRRPDDATLKAFTPTVDAEKNKKWSLRKLFSKDKHYRKMPDVKPINIEEMEKVYEQAVGLYKAEEYGHARNLFDQIKATDPKYRWTEWYLKRIGRKMKRQAQVYKVTGEAPEDLSAENLFAISEKNRKAAKKEDKKVQRRDRKTLKGMEKRYREGLAALAKSKKKLMEKEEEWEKEFLGPGETIVKAIAYDDDVQLERYLESHPPSIEELKEQLNKEIFTILGIEPEGKLRKEKEQSMLLAKIEGKLDELRDQEKENLRRAAQIEARTKAYRQQAADLKGDELKELRQQQRKLSREEKKEWWSRQQDIRKQLDKKREYELVRMVEPMYNDARVLYEEQNYQGAKAKFELINRLYPGYKEAKLYVEKSIKKIESGKANKIGWNDSKELKHLKKQLAQAHREIVMLSNNEKIEDESKVAENARRRNVDYRKARDQQKQAIDKKLDGTQVRKSKDLKRLKREVEEVYDEGVWLYKLEKVMQAQDKFARVDMLLLSGGFPQDYLKKIRKKKERDIARFEEKIRKRKEKQIRARDKAKAKKKKEVARLEAKAKKEEKSMRREREKLAKEREAMQLGKTERVGEEKSVKSQEKKKDEIALKINERADKVIKAEEKKLAKEKAKKERQVKQLAEKARKERALIERERQKIAREKAKHDREMARLELKAKQENEANKLERVKLAMEKRDFELKQKGMDRTSGSPQSTGKDYKESAIKQSRREKREMLRRKKDEERIKKFEEREMARRRRQAEKDAMRTKSENSSVKHTVIAQSSSDHTPTRSQTKKDTPSTLEEKIKKQRAEITQLLEKRNKELRAERERIHDEFQQHLNDLYERGEEFFERKDYAEAIRIFTEVDDMEKGYKDTQKYIDDLHEMNIYYDPSEKGAVIHSTKRNKLDTRLNAVSDALDKIERQLR